MSAWRLERIAPQTSTCFLKLSHHDCVEPHKAVQNRVPIHCWNVALFTPGWWQNTTFKAYSDFSTGFGGLRGRDVLTNKKDLQRDINQGEFTPVENHMLVHPTGDAIGRRSERSCSCSAAEHPQPKTSEADQSERTSENASRYFKPSCLLNSSIHWPVVRRKSGPTCFLALFDKRCKQNQGILTPEARGTKRCFNDDNQCIAQVHVKNLSWTDQKHT